MAKAQEAFKLYPTDENIFQLYRILTYGQQRISEADNLSSQAKTFFDGESYSGCKFISQAFDKDPLRYSISINAAFSFYNLKDYKNALKYFNRYLNPQKSDVIEKE